MTFIMSRRVGKRNFLLGDLMISSPTERDVTTAIPSRFDHRLPEVDRRIAELHQKVMLFNNRMAVAWAGNYIIARHIIQRVATIADSYPDADRLGNFIDGLGLTPAERDSVALMFWVITRLEGQNRSYATVFRNVHVGNIDGTAEDNSLFYAGSGAFHFLDIVDVKSHGIDIGEPESNQLSIQMDAGERKLMEVMSEFILRASQVLHDEMTDNMGHAFLYGGGFEIVMEYEDGFLKVPMSQVSWIETEDRIELVGPIFNQTYSPDGVLFIRRFVSVEGAWIQDVFRVPNFLNEHSASVCDVNADIFTVATVHHFMSRDLTKVVHAWGPNPIIRVRFDGASFTATTTPELFRKLAEWPKPKNP